MVFYEQILVFYDKDLKNYVLCTCQRRYLGYNLFFLPFIEDNLDTLQDIKLFNLTEIDEYCSKSIHPIVIRCQFAGILSTY